MKIGDRVTIYREVKKWYEYFLPDFSELSGNTYVIEQVGIGGNIRIGGWWVPKSCLKYAKD